MTFVKINASSCFLANFATVRKSQHSRGILTTRWPEAVEYGARRGGMGRQCRCSRVSAVTKATAELSMSAVLLSDSMASPGSGLAAH